MTEFELGRVANRCGDRLHCEGRSGGFEGVQIIFEMWRRYRVEQEGDPGDARRNLLEQFQPLAAIVGSILVKPVTLPPGRGKLATKPLPTGSATIAKMMGMVRVCCSSAAVVGRA